MAPAECGMRGKWWCCRASLRVCIHADVCVAAAAHAWCLQPNDKRAGTQFGQSLAVDDDTGTVLVGSYLQVGSGMLRGGGAWRLTRSPAALLCPPAGCWRPPRLLAAPAVGDKEGGRGQ
jgi:hypothetical protein